MTSKTQETTHIICCPHCGEDWDIANHDTCQCGANILPSPSQPQLEAQPQQEEDGKLICGRCGKDARAGTQVGDHCGQFFDEIKRGMFCSGSIIKFQEPHPSLQSQLSTLTAENAKLKERLTEQFNINVHLQDENAKLWKALEEEVRENVWRAIPDSEYVTDEEIATMQDTAWEQFKSNLLAK